MTPPGGPKADIYDRISQLARTMHGTVPEGTLAPQHVLEEVTRTAVTVLDGVDNAGITLVRRSAPGRRPEYLESTAATDESARLFDELQHEYGEGPCFEAIWAQQTVRIPDHAHDDRWPRFSAAVVDQTSVRSSLSIQLYVDGHELGALNLHSKLVDGFDDETEETALNLATHAAIALSGARRGTQFRSALASRDIIGQAKGMIMERYDVDALHAFDLLKHLSQESNVSVSDLATRLVEREHPSA